MALGWPSPETPLHPWGDYVGIEGENFAANAPVSVSQCSDVDGTLRCAAPFENAEVDDAGLLLADGLVHAADPGEAFSDCPASRCFIRAHDGVSQGPTVYGPWINRRTTSVLTGPSVCPDGHTALTGVEASTDWIGGQQTSDRLIATRLAVRCGAAVGNDIGSGGNGAGTASSECAPDTYVTGVVGRHGDLFDQLRVICESLDQLDLPTGERSIRAQIGGTGGSAFGPIYCPAGMVAVGIDGAHLGAFDNPIQAIRLMCADIGGTRLALLFGPPDPVSIPAPGVTVSANVLATPPGASTIVPEDIPASAIPAHSVPALGATPLRSIDIEASPLRSIPLRSIPLRSIPLRSIPLRSILLSSIPLRSITWEAILAGTPFAGVPLQSVTLADVLENQIASERFENLTLAQVDLSTTPLRSISVLSLAMGATPLRSIPLRSIQPGENPDTYAFATWCELLTDLGIDCTQFSPESPVIALDLAGVPLRSIPLRSIPLRSIPLRSIDVQASPLRSIPLRSIAIANTPLRSIPLRSIGVEAAPLRSIPLRSIDIDRDLLPLAALAISELSSHVFIDCAKVVCVGDDRGRSQDLQEAQDLGAIATNADLGDLIDVLPQGDLTTLLELIRALIGEQPTGTLGELLDAIWDVQPEIPLGSLGDLIMGLVLAGDYPWEDLPLDEMGAQQFAAAPEKVSVGITYPTAGGALTAQHRVELRLPIGFVYEAGTARLVESTTLRDLADPKEPTVSGNPRTGQTLTWTFERDRAKDVKLQLSAIAGLRLGDVGAFEADVVVDDGRSAEAASGSDDPGASSVTAPSIPDDEASPRAAAMGALELGYIDSPTDIDYFTVPAPPKGSRLRIRLSHLSSDADLVLYQPVASTDQVSAAPLRSIPLRSIPLEDERLGDASAPPETLQDIPLRSIPLRSISANRSTTDEVIDIGSTATGGSYVIQVSGYNGATSSDPYVLRVTSTSPLVAPSCSPVSYSGGSTGQTFKSSLVADQQVETLILFNEERLAGVHGTAAAAAVRGKLEDLAEHAKVRGLVQPVEGLAGVAGAYEAWDAAPCDPATANDVVHAITAGVQSLKTTYPNIENVVLVGGDDLLPMARLHDTTSLSNERDYAGESGGANPITGAFATEHILSDDPYGDLDPIAYLNRRLHVPDLAVGRLVESPSDIVDQIDQFLASGGVLDPKTALSTGYDFLSDGADAVDAALSRRIPDASRRMLNDDQWTSSDLERELLGSTKPDIASINAHFDHHRSLPALGNHTHDESDLFTVDHVLQQPGTPPRLAGRILFSMGCHAGLAVPDGYVRNGADGQPLTNPQDWAQTFGAERAIYVANTGFGYGDTAAVALSERLMRLFADGLARQDTTAGAALVHAKSEYVADLGLYGSYDEKALQEATFYGLPMYQLDGPVTAPPAPKTVVTLDSVQGSTQDVLVKPAFEPIQTPRGNYWSVDGDAQVTHYRPIQPRASVALDAPEGMVVQGAVIESLKSTDTPGVDPVLARPTVDHSSNEPEIGTNDVVFPASLGTVSSFGVATAQKDRLVLLPGQFIGTGGASGNGVQRLFTEIGARVHYAPANSADQTPPAFRSTQAMTDGTTTTTFRAAVDDNTGVIRVLALFRDITNIWHQVELAAGRDGEWVGITTAAADEDIEYFLQAVDATGNVAQTTNKGRYFNAVIRTSDADDFTALPTGTTGANGWYHSDVELTVSGATSFQLNGEPEQAVPADGKVLVTSEGTNVLEFFQAGTHVGQQTVKIDKVEPSISAGALTGTYWQGWALTSDYSCSDTTSGIEICAPVRPETTDPGTGTVQAGDYAGHTAEAPYRVLAAAGFTAPIDNGRINKMKAGAAVPVKWSLPYGDGTFYTSTTGITWSSVPVSCDNGLPTDTVETTVAAASSSLKYDAAAQHYVLTWKTDKGWAGTCRRLTLTMPGIGQRSAVFNFTR
jgi:hypothetical protein